MVRLGLFILSFLCFLSLVAEEEPFDPFVSSLTNTQSLLPTTIQSISAISGEWLDSTTDFIVVGPDPLVLTRSYSADYSSGILGFNWEFNRPHRLIVEKYHNLKKNSGTFKARFHHPSGIKTIHRSKWTKDKIVDLPIHCTRALTNCRSGEISGRTNLHNVLLKLDLRQEHCIATTGSGLLIYFTLDHEDLKETQYFTPVFERKTNGNLISFEKNRFTACSADGSTSYGWIKFYPKSLELVEVEASDGKHASYTFDCYKSPKKTAKRHCLVKASYSHQPQESYEYEYLPLEGKTEHPPNPLLKTKSRPEHRFQQVEYYKLGENSVDQVRTIKLFKKDDFRLYRVKEIKAPVGTDETPIITHRFIYLADHPSIAGRGKSFSGKTEVYNAYMHKTVYSYNREHRPTAITHLLKGQSVYCEEKFIWDEGKNKQALLRLKEASFLKERVENSGILTFLDKMQMFLISKHDKEKTFPNKELLKEAFRPHKHSSRIGNLRGKYTQDGEGNIHHALFFTYDSKGNIRKECFYGNLSGQNPTPIELDNHQRPRNNGVEYYKKQFTYSQDPFNLLLTEQEGNGKRIEYTYVPETDLVSAKYIKDGEEIKFRHFFFYDDNACLIKTIQDDGGARQSDDLCSATQRQITYFHPRQTAPFGVPECIEEKYWDFILQCEVPLKRNVCHYTADGHLSKQEHFDANNIYCYCLSWDYDAHGNIKKENDALGHEITKEYDANDNLILEKKPRESIRYVYDYANRLIRQERTADDRCFITHHSYDYMGNRIATIDPFGNQTTYLYDELGRLIKTQYPDILLIDDWIMAPVAETAYDIHNHPIVITQPGEWKTHLTYNARGKPTTKIHPDGRVEKLTYYLDGTLANFTAPNGTQTIYRRDFLGRVLAEEIFDEHHQKLRCQTFTYQGLKLTSKTDAEGCTTHYTHDGAGRLTAETCEDFYKTYAYDSLGRIAKVTQWFGHSPQEISVQAFEYDFLNRLVEERLENAAGIPLQRVCYSYDELGNQTRIWKQTAAGEAITLIEYNADSQPIKITDAEGHSTHFSYHYTHLNALGQQVLQVEITDSTKFKTRSAL